MKTQLILSFLILTSLVVPATGTSIGFFPFPILPPPVNVALTANGGVATASSSYNGSYLPDTTINGDRLGLNWGSGGGWNDGTSSTFPDWIQIDFSSAKNINEVDVFFVQDNYAAPSTPTLAMTFTLYGAPAFQVQYWNGSAWVDVTGGNITGNDKIWRKITFSTITTDRIRILVNSSIDGWSRITEVEAWTE